MTRRILTLLLLAVFGFGLSAGLHPCEASHGEQESAQPSCHGAAAHPSGGPEARAGSLPAEEDGNGCDVVCQHACHMTAVAGTRPITFAIAPVSQAVAEAPASSSPLFAQPIDHIPLG